MVQIVNQNIQHFFTYWKYNSIPNVKKQNRQTDDVINFGEFSSLSLESPSVVTSILYVCYLYEEQKAGSNVNELQYRMFSRKAFSGDSLPATLDILVLYLRRASSETFTWKLAYVPVLNLPKTIENGKMCTELTGISSVPDAITELTRCK